MSAPDPAELPTETSLRAAADATSPYTVGLEDELLLLEPETLELAPRSIEVLELLAGDQRFKLELPAAQLEIATAPCATVPEAAAILLSARRRLAERCTGLVMPASAGVHPFSPGSGQLNSLPRYEQIVERYGPFARRQMVFALQVHVAVGDAARTLAVYNAARSYLPLLAALAANAPLYEGRDTGLASVRPKLGELLPRQGIPPALPSWAAYAAGLRWGAQAGALPDAGGWWWELRPHHRFGTLEFRVPDAQTVVCDAAAVAAVIQSLVAALDERAQAGEPLPVAASWRIAENRASACRDGVTGSMADLETGTRLETCALLERLLDELEPVAHRLRCDQELAHARTLVRCNGAIRQREIAQAAGAQALARWLAERFCASDAG